jgi:N-ethylmaleimide reductase
MVISSISFCAAAATGGIGPYGGPVENRAKLLLEVTDAVIGVWGAGRVAVRISPLNSYNFMKDDDPVGLTSYVCGQLSRRKLAFLNLMRGDFFGQQKGELVTPARKHFSGPLVGNMGYTAAEAAAAIDSGTLDAVSFGHHYVSNPDLVERFKRGLTPVEPDQKTLYTPGPAGYTDYPALAGGASS